MAAKDTNKGAKLTAAKPADKSVKPAAPKSAKPAAPKPAKKPAASKPVAAKPATAHPVHPAAPAKPVKSAPMAGKVEPKHHEAQGTEEAIGSAIGRVELFFEKNSKTLVTILVAIVVVVGAYFGYKYLYMQPRSQRAANMAYVAEQMFAVDSFKVALNGDGNNAGFLQVIDKFGSTPQGNMARHYAGICYLHLGDMDNAMKFLTAYRHVDGVPGRVIGAQNYGLQGDIISQRGDYAGAADKYRKAVDAAANSFTTPYYLRKLGLMLVLQGKGPEAIRAFERVKRDYPQSLEARDIDKFIGEAQQVGH